ncbi:MAG: helix-turn-helix transcriptional regulator [Thermoguttaceae bacterium]|nr:helix-turn-helix transcriptional regulator [Thermoguttaceae bacterium]
METIALRIRKLRKHLGLSQKEFAQKLNRKQSTVGMWESGERNVPDFTYLGLAQVFGVREEWLRTGEGEMFASAASPESTANLPSPFEYAQAQGCNETISRLFARYCALPKDGKEAFEKIVDALLVEKTVSPTPTGSRIVVNNATSERGDAVINQMFRN